MTNSDEVNSSSVAKTKKKSEVSESSEKSKLSTCVESETADKSKQTADKGKQTADKGKQTAEEKKETQKRRVSEQFGKIKHHNFVPPVITPPKRNGRRSLPNQISDEFEKSKSKKTKNVHVKKEEVYDFEEIPLKQIKPTNVKKDQAQMLEIDEKLSKNAKIDKLTEKPEIDQEDIPLKHLKRRSGRHAKAKQNCDKTKPKTENSEPKNEAMLINETEPVCEKNMESNSENVGKIDVSMMGIKQENKEV